MKLNKLTALGLAVLVALGPKIGMAQSQDGPAVALPPSTTDLRRSPDTPENNDPVEVIVFDLNDEDRATLVALGYQVIEEVQVAGLQSTMLVMRIPPSFDLTDAWRLVRALPSGEISDFNHYYRGEQARDCPGPRCPERAMVGWAAAQTRGEACGAGVTIGMIDSGINARHETFRGALMEVAQIPHATMPPADTIHGTAVAALLVGDPASATPGLVPAARLIAVDAFHSNGTDERADLTTLLEGINLLVQRGATVINLSLAGPHNLVLEHVIETLTRELDIVVVAAVGNSGPSAKPAYPAGYEMALAVTAVDRSGGLYGQAVRGVHVDLAAPGVDVWTAASLKGARVKTGTSFAAPFVTAAAALMRLQRPDLSARAIAAELRNRARDLGAPGFDTGFGNGLVSMGALCSR